MDKVYQVFVSSTFSDLQDERKQVSDTLAKAGFIPAGMELFPATDQKQLEFIKRIIDRCDYYVVIVAAKYGSLDGDKSFTEKEYEYAVEKKVPVLAFIHKDPGSIANSKSEQDQDQINRLVLFRERLKTSRVVAFWINIHELKTEVLTAVTNSVNLFPGTGWIRGDQAIDPKFLQEAEGLRAENKNLKKQLQEYDAQEVTFPTHLAQPSDQFELPIVITEAGKKDRIVKIKTTWKMIFLRAGNRIVRESREEEIVEVIARYVLKNSPEHKKVYIEKATYSLVALATVRVRFHLEALGLIRITAKGEYPSGYVTWALTEKGRRYLANYLAIKKSDSRIKLDSDSTVSD